MATLQAMNEARYRRDRHRAGLIGQLSAVVDAWRDRGQSPSHAAMQRLAETLAEDTRLDNQLAEVCGFNPKEIGAACDAPAKAIVRDMLAASVAANDPNTPDAA